MKVLPRLTNQVHQKLKFHHKIVTNVLEWEGDDPISVWLSNWQKISDGGKGHWSRVGNTLPIWMEGQLMKEVAKGLDKTHGFSHWLEQLEWCFLTFSQDLVDILPFVTLEEEQGAY